ncbi:MAG: ribulose-phosphate 3-epimerase [Chloroflexota bacterium]|nr:ribulose-phosphate 3-epimerase [Chloroflexota bacterium]
MPERNTMDRLRELIPTVSVGMLTADLLNLGSELAAIEQAGVGLLHVDVMDGNFCPGLTVGPPLIKAMNRSSMLLDAHLMIQNPLDSLESYVKAGADIVTIQVESTIHPHRVLQALGKMTSVREPGGRIVRGVALNPGTPLEALDPLMDEIELIMLLAVNPGWSGQKFIPSTEGKIANARQMTRNAGKDILIAVDGGITRDNVAQVSRMGPDIVVSGSAVFDGKAPAENALFMLDSVRGN